MATTNVDDIANITMTADATVTVNGDELPVGELLTDNFGDVFDEIEGVEETESGLEFSLPVTAVEQDGRWYVSGMYAIAEEARQEAGFDEIPEEGIVPKGGDSPEGAVDVLLDGVEQLDLSAIIGAINPNEAEALQRYAPLFLGEAQDALDEIPATMEFTGVEYEVSGDGSTRSVIVTAAHLAGEFRDPTRWVARAGAVHARLCRRLLPGRGGGESIDTCAGTETGDLRDVEDLLAEFGADEAFGELRAIWEDILSDYEQPGVTVKEVDGEWYVSPIATSFDQFFAVSHALDRDELGAGRRRDRRGRRHRSTRCSRNEVGQLDDTLLGDPSVEDPRRPTRTRTPRTRSAIACSARRWRKPPSASPRPSSPASSPTAPCPSNSSSPSAEWARSISE